MKRIFHPSVSSPYLTALIGLIVLGAALRFSTLGLQSFRYDEAVTVGRVLQPNLFDTLAAVPHSESTPPLYYFVAWLWSKPFGTDEVWIRSLSALAGTGTILVAYLGVLALPLSRRAGLITAAIVAVSPVLVWFSQDARAYALVVLLSALSFLFFARARRSGTRRDLAWWAATSALAVATHYFAFFVVVTEAALLLLSSRNRRRVTVVLLAVAAAGLLLVPIALKQTEHGHANWISGQPIGGRIERAGAKLVGSDNGNEHGSRQPGSIPLYIPAALALTALMLLAWRSDPDERRGAEVAALVGAGGAGLPLLLALLGPDYFDGRNVLPAFVPLIALLGAGFGVRRARWAGIALAAGFCLCSLAFTLEIDRLPRLQRENLRNAAAKVGNFNPGVAVVTVRYVANQPLSYYLGARSPTTPVLPLREIVLIGSQKAANRNAARILPSAFHRVESKPVSYNFTLTRFRATKPVRVRLSQLERGGLVGEGHRSSVLTPP